MTKVEAIAKVMEDNGGTASLGLIYENITKYYPSAKESRNWEAGLRGVLYREIRNGKRFKRIGLSIYALLEYQEEKQPDVRDTIRMHSYIEGICVELGNFNGFHTYTADPSASYRDNFSVGNFASLQTLPDFSYPQILTEAKRIDVLWLNKKGLIFPRRVYEVVDSIGTLNGAFNRSLQLQPFRTQFYIVGPEKHRKKYNETLELSVYKDDADRFNYINYEEIIELYQHTARIVELEQKIRG